MRNGLERTPVVRVLSSVPSVRCRVASAWVRVAIRDLVMRSPRRDGVRMRRAGALSAVILAVVVVVVVARSSLRESSRAALRGGSVGRLGVFALLANNHLLRVDSSGQVESDVALGRAPSRFVTSGRLLASARGKVFALVLGRGREPDRVLVLDDITERVAAWYALVRGVEYRGLLLAGHGALLVFGNRPGVVLESEPGVPAVRASSVVVTFVDLRSRGVTHTVTVRKPARHDWRVYWGALSKGGNTLYLSYHGGCGPNSAAACTTGADMLTRASAAVRRCPTRHPSNVGCIALAHGRVATYGSQVVATTGSEAMIVASSRGRVVETLHTGISGTHLMDFALDRHAGKLYVSSCAGRGSLRVVDLQAKSARTLARGLQCGEISTLLEPHLLVIGIAANERVNGGHNELLMIDTRSGKLLHVVPTDAQPIALLGQT